jgi:hypothetical protein
VLGQAGVQVIWLDCTAPGSCAEDPGMNEFWLHVANWKPAGGSEQELGFTTFNKETASGIGVAGVCYPMVRQVAADIKMEEGLILAAAMAHEIGHVLGAGHSSSGIMQAKFNRQSIVSMSQGGYVFTRNQAGGIRADAVRRTAGAGAAAPYKAQPETCTSNPLVAAAWRHLPSDQRFPCDSGHIVLVPDFAGFLKARHDIAGREDLREKARNAFAFSISAAGPIYINLDSHQRLVDSYITSRPWIAFAIAGVLAHEIVHAKGELSEAAGLLAEYELDRAFREQEKLPREFDLEGMKEQYLDALNQEANISRTAAPRK